MSEKRVTLITLCILAVVVIAGGVGVWYLEFNVLSEKKKELEDLKAQVADFRKKSSALPEKRKEIAAKKKEEEEKSKRIPNYEPDEYNGFLDNIEKMRRQAGIFIGSFSYVKPRRAGGRGAPTGKQIPKDVHKVDYEITCIGRFYPLLRFVNLIETQNRFVEIKSATISSMSDRSGSGAAVSSIREMTLNVTTYSFKPPEAPTKQPTGPITVKEGEPIPSTELPE